MRWATELGASKSVLSRFGIDLFTRNEFQDTSIEQIVEPLGVSTRTFFRYFATKDLSRDAEPMQPTAHEQKPNERDSCARPASR